MLPAVTFSQVNTDNTQTVEWYVQNVLVGAGVATSNVQYNGGSAAVPMPQVGQFDNLPAGADVGLAEGMILGSGDITMASQANISGGSSLGGTGNSGVVQIWPPFQPLGYSMSVLLSLTLYRMVIPLILIMFLRPKNTMNTRAQHSMMRLGFF